MLTCKSGSEASAMKPDCTSGLSAKPPGRRRALTLLKWRLQNYIWVCESSLGTVCLLHFACCYLETVARKETMTFPRNRNFPGLADLLICFIFQWFWRILGNYERIRETMSARQWQNCWFCLFSQRFAHFQQSLHRRLGRTQFAVKGPLEINSRALMWIMISINLIFNKSINK